VAPAGRWKIHLGRLVLAVVLVAVAGLLTGLWWQLTLTALSIYLVWNLINGVKFYLWLYEPDRGAPKSLGLWAEVFDRIDAMRKSSQERRRKHQSAVEEFQSMTDAFPDATLVIDEINCITWFNDTAHKFLGLRNPEDLGQPVTNLLREPDFANWLEVVEKVQSDFEMDSPLDAGLRLSVSAVRYRAEQRLLILRDITEIHNLEIVRRDFVANVSHELRTPLTVLLGYLEAIGDECPEDLAPAVSRMQGQARRMRILLDDLLELSRLQSGNQDSNEQIIDMTGLLGQLREHAEELSQGRHRLHFEVDFDLRLLGIPGDLESTFRNLVNNAIHYTPNGGSVSVAWRNTPDGPVLEVRDTGIGIPDKDIPRLTERFYRVGSDRSRHTGGTGLGLAIVKHVLNAHQARLVIESELGEGSFFQCAFPPERGITNPKDPS
jgi:two-component system phosphate regulon sensor histidine kinase PhoR